MPVKAVRLVRKMRGGAQAHLIEADNGRFYVVKFTNNPQHRRILVNEHIASSILQYLQISAPRTAVVQLTPSFLEANPDVYLQLGGSRIPVPPGWHFGSEFPGDPDRVAVFDFVPDALLAKVANAGDFAAVLAFDKWTGNADARQCVYLRTRIREFAPAWSDHPLTRGFVALMIDHGFIFNGPHWTFADSPVQGLYMRTCVYDGITGIDAFEPWLSRIRHFPEEEIDRALRHLPPEWVDDEDALHATLDRLLRRRGSVADLIADSARGRRSPFARWNVR